MTRGSTRSAVDGRPARAAASSGGVAGGATPWSAEQATAETPRTPAPASTSPDARNSRRSMGEGDMRRLLRSDTPLRRSPGATTSPQRVLPVLPRSCALAVRAIGDSPRAYQGSPDATARAADERLRVADA